MKKFLLAIICTLFAVHGTSAMADDFSFTGNLSDDDDVQLFEFSVGVTSTVTMRTYSYAGGVMADGTNISAGGFDPILALFDGNENLIDQNDDGAGVPSDPVTGAAYDTLLEVELDPGNYTVAVSQYSNFAVGPTLSDGFQGSGTLNFQDATGAFRTSFWAFDVLNVESAVVEERNMTPVPTLSQWSVLLLTLMLALIGGRAVYRRKLF